MSALSEVQPSLTIKKESVFKLAAYGFLFIGYLNTVLRVNPQSNITLFRLLLPLAFLLAAFVFRRMMVRCFIIIAIFFIYGMLSSIFLSRFESFDAAYFTHYATLIFLALLTFELIDRFGVQSVYNHLRLVYIIMIGLAIFQFVTSFAFPNTLYRTTINIYYWVENDFSAALAAFIPFLLVDSNNKTRNRILAFLGIAIIVYNSSRIALLGVLFFIIFRLLNRFKSVGYIISIVGVIVVFIVFRDYKLEGNSLYELMVSPFSHIFTLTPYEQYGSIYDRTNALIFGLIELTNTWGFGVGPGNVTNIFKQKEYFLWTAQSMHNFVAQVFVEYGWLILITLVYALLKFFNFRRRLGIKVSNDVLLYAYFVSATLSSLSQSEGLFSNYYFFISLTTAVAYFGNTLGTSQDTQLDSETSTKVSHH